MPLTSEGLTPGNRTTQTVVSDAKPKFETNERVAREWINNGVPARVVGIVVDSKAVPNFGSVRTYYTIRPDGFSQLLIECDESELCKEPGSPVSQQGLKKK